MRADALSEGDGRGGGYEYISDMLQVKKWQAWNESGGEGKGASGVP